MNYQRIYNELIEKFQTNPILKSDETYTEEHHIIPKCMGGTNDKENLVRLPAREHIMAHLLLSRAYPDNRKVVFATNAMLMGNGVERVNRFQALRCFSTRIISSIRETSGRAMRGKGNPMFGKTGELAPCYGRKLSDESRERISRGNKGKEKTPEHRRNLSESKKGVKLSESHRKSISEAQTGEKNPFFGKTHTDEFKDFMSNLKKGIKLSSSHRKKISDSIKGERNPMFGKKGVDNPNYGKKRTEQTRANIKVAQVNRVPDVQGPDGIIYESLSDCSRRLNIPIATLSRWVKNKPEKGFKYL